MARKPTHAEADERGGRDLVAAAGDQAQAGADQPGDEHDDEFEGELVVRPEQGDGDVLGAGRLVVDEDLGHRGKE